MLNARVSSSGGRAGPFPWHTGSPGGKDPEGLIPVHSVPPQIQAFALYATFLLSSCTF